MICFNFCQLINLFNPLFSKKKVFRSFLNQSYYHRTGNEISNDGLSLLFATSVSIFAIGGMLGGLGGFVADMFGR